ncbi:antibiotic biosynthesis monooxygenase [Nocardiopsis sp. CNT312]|uniref:antibiotic biosynthesis monooxygenase family protein n=1 Tax=Nocardiopsis sp. CNT312 TaxID=1137268 RepID=UPI00048DA1BF|nr:antibiotic biosynthesis monooxygenase [Nocardiopsis sp. CNT312]
MSETVIRADDGLVTFINVFEVDPSDQQALVDILNEGIEEVMSARPGFVSATVLPSKDGNRVVNYAQWNSPEDVQATMADPRAQGYAKKAGALAASAAPGLYGVASVHRA